MLVYNVHGLVHLSNNAAKYGCLDNVSLFPFENFLGKFKLVVRKPSFALQQQTIRRLPEQKLWIHQTGKGIPNSKKRACSRTVLIVFSRVQWQLSNKALTFMLEIVVFA